MWKGSVTPRCAECAFGVDTSDGVQPDERWAPIMLTPTQSYAANSAGCIEQATGSEACGRAYEQMLQCSRAACKFSCTTQAEYDACQNDPKIKSFVCADARTALIDACPANLGAIHTACQANGTYLWDEPLRRACVSQP